MILPEEKSSSSLENARTAGLEFRRLSKVNPKGRPLIYDEPVVKKAFALERKVAAWLRTKDNMSRFVNKILKEEMVNESKRI